MSALPWVERQPIDPDAGYFAMASRLPLTAYRFIPGFLARAVAIRRQLARAPGLIGYRLDAQLAGRTSWTFSVWADRESLELFAGSDPHRRLTAELRSRMGESSFNFFRVEGGELPLSRSQIEARVS